MYELNKSLRNDTFLRFRVQVCPIKQENLPYLYFGNPYRKKLCIVGSTEAPSKVFLLFFLLPYWLKLNHLKSRLECGFSDIFSRHFCSAVAETIGVTINPASSGAKNVQKTTFEVAEMILGTLQNMHQQLLIEKFHENLTLSWGVDSILRIDPQIVSTPPGNVEFS